MRFAPAHPLYKTQEQTRGWLCPNDSLRHRAQQPTAEPRCETDIYSAAHKDYMDLMNNAESKTHFCPIFLKFNSASARFTLYVFITVSQNLKKHSNKLSCFVGKAAQTDFLLLFT